ncbi:hypothetical protein BD309DRAFT_972172 [Dichomitus squalens]|uniref:Uncharacterized protein n=2 Tax=Dichomitus squalens TaxID=114155 RepID=A0A4Q9PJL3_9APHY|nr:uncharacterized protein DICSQDRAFT_161289 [Dichomitus squalens LYAD-421 SS1]EJF62014.1 hypothetical protein DICSQDRAFT_161289 [Dichomitus squalens LYAD-421 SS1]TBU38311.1 hypothetical protein BD309DRAFT_972172 [Dichomitus squalens]TBU54275.1 hypothetical protein BD310DRAFT_936375 [Dichomitus squalens]
MTATRRLESFILAIAILFLGLNFTYKLINLSLLHRRPKHDLVNGGVWNVEREHVAFAFDSGLRYDLNASQAWAALVPGDGIVHLGAQHEPFMVSMFHQLRCLDVMRDQLTKTRAQREEQPARHCMNYIRQMILCRGDTNLDPYQYPSNIHPVEPHPVRRCLDWRAVYEAVEENQREYAEWAPDGSATRI